jgi:signal transduction histidine kinase
LIGENTEMAADAIRAQSTRASGPEERTLELPRGSQLVPVVVLILGCVVTAVSVKSSWVHLAYRLPRMHAIFDTSVGLISLLLAYLVFQRVEVLQRERDYELAFALGFSGLVNLFSAITQGVSSIPLSRGVVWMTTIGRLLVAVMFAVAALTPDTRRHEDFDRPLRLAIGMVLAFTALMLAVALLSLSLPWSRDLAVSPTDASKPLFVGPTLLLAAQAAIAVAYAIAGWAFSRRASRDDLMTWVASFCLLFALASVDYLAFPSIFSDWIYVGDFLRLAGVFLLLVGAVREIGRLRRDAIVIEERRRVAHDLHDGVAQELALIATMARRLEREPTARDARRLADAAERALDESRLVISALAGAGNASEQLTLTARDTARNFDLDLMLSIPNQLDLPPATVEALCRIMREAITNIGRHAHASSARVTVDVSDGFLLEVTDDGRGFDPTQDGGFGLTSMKERAESVGGTFEVDTSPAGTTIRIEDAVRGLNA